MTTAPPRSLEQRIRDSRERFQNDVDGTATTTDPDDATGGAFAAKTGFGPRELQTPYRYFRVLPGRIMAWREVDEFKGRVLMREGRWLG